MPAVVDKELCIGCEACVGECPVDAIEMKDGKACVNDSCVDCGACVEVCPVDAITMQ
ncbi:MAG: 4Fe-4S binding protein [Victivallaceae bacterium]|jgi:Fe-S-cluster-containing hydrogenase component 2